MSAYVVEPETIARIIHFYRLDRIYTVDGSQSLGIVAYLSDVGIDLLDDKVQYKLFRLMYALNVKAVCARYPNKVKPSDYPIPDRIPGGVDTPDEFQALKSIECYLYQCSEADLDKTAKLYRVIEWTKHRLADAIIHRLPAYEAAEWG